MKKKESLIVVLIITIISQLHSQIFLPVFEPEEQPEEQIELKDPVGKPYGGGSGYFPIISPEESDIVINTNDFNSLKSELASASFGDIIYVKDNLQIEIPRGGTLIIPDGVTMASGRGRNGSKGALIFSNNFLETDYMFDSPGIKAGNNVQITGFRLRGPDSTSSYTNYGKQAAGIKHENGNNLEIHNCEIYNWYVYGIYIIESYNVNIHHNYIHNNQNPHIGYGIVNRNKTDTIISYNIFNRNRHDIAAIKNTIADPPSYTARSNLVGPDGLQHRFDMHGCGYTDRGCPDMFAKDDASPENLAGRTINIINNYFLPMNSTKRHSFVIRGIPEDMANIIGNYFPNDFSEPDFAVHQTLMWADPSDSSCKPIDTSYEWNLATGAGGTDKLNNGSCYYAGKLQLEPNHINLVGNVIGHPIYIRVINWDVQSSNQVWKIVGPEIKFTNLDVSSFAYGDFNNDGRTDILYQDNISWSGLTEWEAITDQYNVDSNHIIDFNGDGVEDRLNIVHPTTIWP